LEVLGGIMVNIRTEWPVAEDFIDQTYSLHSPAIQIGKRFEMR